MVLAYSVSCYPIIFIFGFPMTVSNRCGESVHAFSFINATFWVSGYFRLVSLSFHEYSVANLNIKNFMSPTPLNCVLKALIFALKDSAEAFVNLSWK